MVETNLSLLRRSRSALYGPLAAVQAAYTICRRLALHIGVARDSASLDVTVPSDTLGGVYGLMPCYKPLLAYVYGRTAAGKQAIKFLGKGASAPPNVEKIISVPCGQCIGCRLDYSREWANRCLLEATYHDSNYFVTLTYANVVRAMLS